MIDPGTTSALAVASPHFFFGSTGARTKVRAVIDNVASIAVAASAAASAWMCGPAATNELIAREQIAHLLLALSPEACYMTSPASTA